MVNHAHDISVEVTGDWAKTPAGYDLEPGYVETLIVDDEIVDDPARVQAVMDLFWDDHAARRAGASSLYSWSDDLPDGVAAVHELAAEEGDPDHQAFLDAAGL